MTQYLLEFMNIMNIKKSPSNYALLLLLATAFLTMQWTTTHVHLSEQHSHNGSHHQLQFEAHAHSLNDQTTTIDFSHQSSHTIIIEFGKEYGLSKKETQKIPLTFIVGAAPCLSPPLLLVSTKIPVIENTRSSYLNRSTLSPRAPPHIS